MIDIEYKIKFNLFKLDNNGYPAKMENKTIYLESSTNDYDLIRNEVLKRYPEAKYIVIFLNGVKQHEIKRKQI